jgi:hypothetical protein
MRTIVLFCIGFAAAYWIDYAYYGGAYSRPAIDMLRHIVLSYKWGPAPMGIVSVEACRRRADEYRALAARASDEKERDRLLSLCELLEHLIRIEESGERRSPK